MDKLLKPSGKVVRFFHRLNTLAKRELDSTSIFYEMERMTRKKSAEYISENLGDALLFFRDLKYWNFIIQEIPKEGLLFEFGVYKGKSINYLAEQLDETGDKRRIFGFDSFTGLAGKPRIPEKENNNFNLNGRMPVVLPNVKLHKGVIEETLTTFMDNLKIKDKSIAYLHMDVKQYRSTKYILENLLPHLKKGSIIDFDNYLGYIGWQQNEFRAMAETIGNSCEYEHVAFCEMTNDTETRIKAAIRITRLYKSRR